MQTEEDAASQWQSIADELALKERKLNADQTPTLSRQFSERDPNNPELPTDGRNASDPPPKLFKEGHRKKNKEPLTKAQVLAYALKQQARYAELAKGKPVKGTSGQPRSLRDWDDEHIIYGREHLRLQGDAVQLFADLIERTVDVDPLTKGLAFKEATRRARSANGTAGKRDQLMASAGSEYWGTQRRGYRLLPLSERSGDYLMPLAEHYKRLSQTCGDVAELISSIAENPKRIAA
jgi:hypothetical protein